MKLKRHVEDFQVEEEVSLEASGGELGLYRLRKQSMGTLEAVDAIRKKWSLERGQVEFAGLKDKHALTTQYVTIRSGPRRGLAQSNLQLDYVGQTSRAIHASDIRANRFLVVIRDLAEREIEATRKALISIAHDGLPNYFDDQRFGSLGESGEYIAKPWCLGDFERALWLALADPNAHDRPEDREKKRILREHWGDWRRYADLLPDSDLKPVMQQLVHRPTDFRRAIAALRHELRSIWLAAFQSHLWNQVLARCISQVCRPEQCVQEPIGRRSVPFFENLNESQRERLLAMNLPLPSARLHLADESLKPIYDQVLAAEGMELRQVRVKYPRDSFFSKGERAAVFQPGGFQYDFADDEVYAGRQKLTLRFSLPRGCYATILVKRVAGGRADELEE